MYKRFVSAMYTMNIIFQCIITLVIPAALMFLLSWLLVSKAGAPSWLYVPLLSIGFISGIFSMIKFAISASEGLERLERSRENNSSSKGGRNE